MTYAMKFPFRIINGSVAMTSIDAEAVQAKVMFCMGTQVNERVMRPDWGIDVMQTVYAVGGDLAEGVEEAIVNAFQRWFPTYTLKAVILEVDPDDPTKVSATIRYGDIQSPTDETARVELSVPALNGENR